MKNGNFGFQILDFGFFRFSFRDPQSFDKTLTSPSMVSSVEPSAIRNPHGFTYIALLTAVVIMGILLASTGKYWSSVAAREKEEELLFRGDQYRRAIERYVMAIPGRSQYPQSIDELLKDNRTAAGKRHLRQKYKDPITGEDFEVIRDLTKGNRIIGVYSSSGKIPFKQAGFPGELRDFDGKRSYSDWKFIYTAPPQRR